MVHIPSIPHCKGLDMTNLQYEIRFCQKGHNKVTKTVLSLLRFFMYIVSEQIWIMKTF